MLELGVSVQLGGGWLVGKVSAGGAQGAGGVRGEVPPASRDAGAGAA